VKYKKRKKKPRLLVRGQAEPALLLPTTGPCPAFLWVKRGILWLLISTLVKDSEISWGEENSIDLS